MTMQIPLAAILDIVTGVLLHHIAHPTPGNVPYQLWTLLFFDVTSSVYTDGRPYTRHVQSLTCGPNVVRGQFSSSPQPLS